MDLWEAGRFDALEAEVTPHAKVGVARLGLNEWGVDSVSEGVSSKFHRMVLDGKLCGAVRFATGRGQGGPLRPDDACSKTGRPVMDVLRYKHPDCVVPTVNSNGSIPGFDSYVGQAPDFVPHASSKDSVSVAAKKIHGSQGPSGVDAVMVASLWQCIRESVRGVEQMGGMARK